MNCRATQEKITDSLAAGMAALPPEVAAHSGSCQECRAFYEQERSLFGSLDAGLQNIVNEPVPLSFFVGLRARLDDAPAARSLWNPTWTFAALVTSVVFVLGVITFRSHYQRGGSGTEANRVVARVDRVGVSEAPASSDEAIRSGPAPVRAARKAPRGRDQVGTAAPGVIVLAEEKQAFARFIARLPQSVAVPSALKPAVPQQADMPMDIALIEIQDVEIAPLDSMNGDGR